MHILFTGTDAESAKGGIGVVMVGYFAALRQFGVTYEQIPTYHPTITAGKWAPWLKALPVLFKRVKGLRCSGKTPLVYSHAGDGVSLFREAVVLGVARLAGARTIMQVHSPRVDGYLDSWFQRHLLQLAFAFADRVCVLTPWWKSRIRDAGITANITVIPNPMPPDLESIAKQKRIPLSEGAGSKNMNVLAMARLVSGKGVDLAIEAMRHLPNNVHLIIAGDGEQRQELMDLVKKIGLEERIHFNGWVSGGEKENLLVKADLFCLPSSYDAFPMSMVEAMAYGLPVVALRWGGIPDMVADGRAGILIDGADATKIAEAIRELLDEKLRVAMGEEGKRWILELSSASRVGERLKKLFMDLSSAE